MIHSRTRLRTCGGVLAALIVLVVGSALGLAQGATPTETGEAHPAHIHRGTCAGLGDVVFPLTDVDAIGPAGTASGATPEDDASPAAGVATGVELSFTLVDASLDDIVDGGHAINVHESEANIDTYIACGDIGGTITPDPASGEGRLVVVALRELDASGYSGVAVLREADSGTGVTLYLVQGGAGGTPVVAGSGESEADGAAAVTVEIRDFAYGPETVTIPVGGTVTWTNQDAAPHTATARDRDVLQSGTIAQGESFSQTFETAGTYEYFCEFHANMKGTVIVE